MFLTISVHSLFFVRFLFLLSKCTSIASNSLVPPERMKEFVWWQLLYGFLLYTENVTLTILDTALASVDRHRRLWDTLFHSPN